MSAYGDCLKRYIKDKRVSVRKLSLETKIDRTLIQKYLSGDRLPKNMDEVNQISDCLMLSPEKKKSWCGNITKVIMEINSTKGSL